MHVEGIYETKWNKKIVIGSVLVVIAFIFSKSSYINFYFHLVTWWYITLFSILIITFAGYFYGLKYGIISCLVYSLLKFIFAVNIYYPLQGKIDYVLSYVIFFISGFSLFRKNVNSLSITFILSFILRWLFASLQVVKEYTPDNLNPIIYSLEYNGAYIFIEMAVSLVLINIRFIK